MTARKSSRGPPRSNTKVSKSDFAPRRHDPPLQPLPVNPVITIARKLVQINVTLSEESGSAPVTFAALMAGVPGGLTYWDRFRVNYVHVYGDQRPVSDSGANSISVTVAAAPSWNQPGFQVTDIGTEGNLRPRVGFELGLLDKARWFNSASADLLCVVAGPPGSVCLVQASVEIISPTLPVV